MTGYTHAIFSDFSGDDGLKFDAGSSSTLVAVWLVSREEDVRYNEEVIFRIKRAVGCKARDELKYRSVRRVQHNKAEALELLREARADVFSLVVFKKRERDEYYRDPTHKGLVVVMNSWPVDSLIDDLRSRYGEVRPRVVIDEIHWLATQERVTALLTNEKALKRQDIQFRASAATPLIQMADLFAGALREAMEQIEGAQWPPCMACWNRNFRPRDCSWKRRRQGVAGFRTLKSVYPSLFKDARLGAMHHGLHVQETELCKKLEFIDCLLLRK